MIRTRWIWPLICVVILSGCRTLRQPDFDPRGPDLKVLSYNVNWAYTHPLTILDFIEQSDADVVCLQETDKYWKQAIVDQFRDRYPSRIFEGWSGVGGIAILSRYEIRNVRVLPPGPGWFPALLVDVATPIATTQVLNVHLRPPRNRLGAETLPAAYSESDLRLSAIKRFMSQTDPFRPLIVAGDFNENDDNLVSFWLENNGYLDSLSLYDNDPRPWRWTNFGAAVEHRYEHMFLSRHFTCTGSRTLRLRASEHLPIEAVVTMK